MKDRSMSGDSSYQVESHDWPIAPEEQLAAAKVLRVLASFDRFFPKAVEALASVDVRHRSSGD